MKKIIIGFLIFLLAGCTVSMNSVCNSLQPGDSDLCALADSMGVKLEDIGNGLVLANLIAIDKGEYTLEQAVDVLLVLHSLIEAGISYNGLRSNLIELDSAFPGLLDIGFIYINRLNSTKIMKRADREILLSFIQGQIDNLS